MDNVPTYRLTVTGKEQDIEEVFNALVDRPAIESHFVAFGKVEDVEELLKFSLDEERRLVTGAVLIPNMLIPRKSEQLGAHNVYFTADDIELIVKMWAEGGRHNNINLQHDRAQQPEGVYLFEAILSDEQRGISAPSTLQGKFPDKTWFHTYFVKNDDVWNDIKSGKYKGFSFEMRAQHIKMSAQEPDPID